MGVTIVIGGFGCYSQVWNGGEEIRPDLRPAAAEELTGTGRWMHQLAVRDGQDVLASGIAYLFGRAECPGCVGVFTVADEYTSANRPVMRPQRPGCASWVEPQPDRDDGDRAVEDVGSLVLAGYHGSKALEPVDRSPRFVTTAWLPLAMVPIIAMAVDRCPPGQGLDEWGGRAADSV